MNQHNFFMPPERYTNPANYISVSEPSHTSGLNVPLNSMMVSNFWQAPLLNENFRARTPTHQNPPDLEDPTEKKRKPLKRVHENKPAEVITPEQHHLSIKNSPSYYLGLFIDTDVINWLINETQGTKNIPPVMEDEMRCFIAILFLSGYVDLPRRRMFWERSPDTHCPLVSGAMQRDRFEAIFTSIHSKKDETNLIKIVELLNARFLRYRLIDEQHSIGQCTESLISKHHNAKGTGKCVKVWCACTRSGYCTWFNPINSNASHSIILNYVNYIKRYQNLNDLMLENLDVSLTSELRKLGVEGRSVDRERSSCLLNPGGVDKLDCNLNLYRTSMRGKNSFYSAILTFCLDLALFNAWGLYKAGTEEKKPLDLLGFRRNIVVYYLQHYAKPILGRKGGRVAKIKLQGKRAPPSDARYDGVRHYVIPQEKQTRCAKCSAKTTTRCQKCDCGVHVKCFVEFHTRPKQLLVEK